MKRNVAILLFDDVEVLDFAGPFEVFAVTSEIHNHEPFNVYTVGETNSSITARNGLSVIPKHSIADCPPPDILVVPGGFGTRKVMKNEALVAWVKEHAARQELTLSVCTGALVLAAAGLLDGKEATTHHENLGMLQDLIKGGTVRPDLRYVEQGNIITSGGISAGIDVSLHVVEKLLGKEAARKTAEYMEYGDWR
ncbi:MAG: DJ-1/PfpI family protein [Anaerolineae bacterium]|nr:MAG: DJ-1/PfpI family protein [Anaerolineae bacterium]